MYLIATDKSMADQVETLDMSKEEMSKYWQLKNQIIKDKNSETKQEQATVNDDEEWERGFSVQVAGIRVRSDVQDDLES